MEKWYNEVNNTNLFEIMFNFIYSPNKKEFIATILIIIACLAFFGFFPANGLFQQNLSAAAFLMIIPLLYVKMVLKKDFKDFGWQWGKTKEGVRWMAISTFLSLLVFYILFHYTDFRQQYFLPAIVTGNFWFFLGYEIFLVGMFVVFYEVFFRGFVLFSFIRLKYVSVFASVFLFAVLLLASENFDWLHAHYLIAAPFAGIIAYQSRSIFYSIAFTWIFIIIADAFFIKTLN